MQANVCCAALQWCGTTVAVTVFIESECDVPFQDVLNEVERNLHDAMGVARNVAMDPRLVPGGGAVEMAVSRALNDKASTVSAPGRCVKSEAGLRQATVCKTCPW